ncbi:MAG: hypothetical protein IT292_06640 [Deltaproteobacteria bacterium]|nr:hypothetical protein [Deltaproteobacteria bacterium]
MILTLSWYVGHLPWELPALYSALVLTAIIIKTQREYQRGRFITQLKSCRGELRSGSTVLIDGLMLRYDSILTTYHLTIGAIASLIKVPSLYLLHKPEDKHAGIFYTGVSLIFGWWTFPSGVSLTTYNLYKNTHGGETISIKDLVDPNLENNTDKFKRLKARLELEIQKNLKPSPINLKKSVEAIKSLKK